MNSSGNAFTEINTAGYFYVMMLGSNGLLPGQRGMTFRAICRSNRRKRLRVMKESGTKSKKIIVWILAIVVVIAAALVIFLVIKNSRVSVGSISVSKNAEELTLSAEEYDAQSLAAALPMLTKLSKLSLPDTNLTADELEMIRKTADGAEVDYTLIINGQTCGQETQKLDLSGMTSEQAEELITKLDLLPSLNEMDMMAGGESSALTVADVKRLSEAVPDADINYEFDLFGNHLSTKDERMEYDSVEIGNAGAEDIRDALSIMPECSYVLLDGCGIDNEIMESLCNEFPDIKFVWRLYIDGGYPFDFLTDEEVLRLTYGLDDENTQVLKYCTNVVYLDIGHNEAITDISFVENMPRLECLILSLSSVTDLSPLKSCQNLTWLELIDCYDLKDISPLQDIPSIRYLNISETAVSDISATDSLPKLERFSAAKQDIPAADQEHFRELHPDCIAIFAHDANPFGYGWRDNYYGDFFEYYLHMREVFHYDGNELFGNQKIALCCPIYLRDYEGYPWYDWQS